MRQLKNNLNFDTFTNDLKLKLSGISGAFMLPIATMAITGFFLSIGGVIASNAEGWGQKIGFGFRSIAFPILQAFPLFLCISFAIAFTKKETAIAIWCSILTFFTFIYFQSAFIDVSKAEGKCCNVCKCCDQAPCCKACCSLLCCLRSGYTVLFGGAARDYSPGTIHRIFGVTTLNTSIFGPILIGGVLIPFIFRKYSDIKLPVYLSYFSGKRFLPFISALSVIPLALLFLLFWPWINTGLALLGNWISKSQGADAFLFGLFEKLLIPTGFHHIFASLFWYSPLGGDIPLALKNGNGDTAKCCLLLACCKKANGNCCDLNKINSSLNSLPLQGDALMGLSIISLAGNSRKVFSELESSSIFAGRLTQGKFPIMQFALPAAAMAIYLTHKKDKREAARKTLFPGIWNSLILGITEPIEFTFMHSVPKLFYLFHSTMCGISFLAMRLLKAHIPTAFSGGIIELLINGVIPYQKDTKFYWWAAVGGCLAIVYFSTFYLVFSRKRDEEEAPQGELISENISPEDKDLPPNIISWKKGLGGWDNVTNYKNCASRLRYDIKDKSKINEAELKRAGVIAVKWVGDNHVQLIVGPKAEEINTNLVQYSKNSSSNK